MLDPFAQFLQHCRGHARSLRMDYKDLWVVFRTHDALQVPNLLGVVATTPNNVGSCSARLHAARNTIVHKNTLTFLCCQNENMHLSAHLQLVIHVVQNRHSGEPGMH